MNVKDQKIIDAILAFAERGEYVVAPGEKDSPRKNPDFTGHGFISLPWMPNACCAIGAGVLYAGLENDAVAKGAVRP